VITFDALNLLNHLMALAALGIVLKEHVERRNNS